MLLLKLKKNPLKKSYTIILSKKKSLKNVSDPVLEKLGTFSLDNNKLAINSFRLAYWISKNIYCTGNVASLLLKFNIFNAL